MLVRTLAACASTCSARSASTATRWRCGGATSSCSWRSPCGPARRCPPTAWPTRCGVATRHRRGPRSCRDASCVFGDSSGTDVIETTPGGYRLALPHDGLDVRRFESFVERARAHTVNRRARSRRRRLRQCPGAVARRSLRRPRHVVAGRRRGDSPERDPPSTPRRASSRVACTSVSTATSSVWPRPEWRRRRCASTAGRCSRSPCTATAAKPTPSAPCARARNTLIDQLGIEPGTELAELHAAILRQDEGLISPVGPPTIAQHCPYKGLSPYEGDDADTFFGRAGEIAACLARLDTTPLLVVAGPSGCGKSSLVRAGVAPELRRRGHAVAVFAARHRSRRGDDRRHDRVGHPDAVLVVDQFEELFAFDDGTGVRAKDFCARLADYATGTAPVIIVVRADHLAHLTIDLTLARLAERGMHLVRPARRRRVASGHRGPGGALRASSRVGSRRPPRPRHRGRAGGLAAAVARPRRDVAATRRPRADGRGLPGDRGDPRRRRPHRRSAVREPAGRPTREVALGADAPRLADRRRGTGAFPGRHADARR